MLNLVVIGDSIAKGYGSTDSTTNSFGAILGEKLSANFTNLGIVGLDTKGLLEKLETDKFIESIENADVICISIGSNDILKPFLSIFADTIGVEGEEKELFVNIQDKLSAVSKKNPVKAADLLSTAMKKMTKNEQIEKACSEFPGQFNKIIDKIYEINPDVLIYADNIYNPYFGVAYSYEGISVFNISQLCEPYVQKLNKTFVSSDKYTVIDMYSVFRQSGYTHVKSGSIENMSGINFDPHPNDDGYKMMADYIYTKMDSIVPRLVSSEFEPYEDKAGGEIVLKFSESVRLVKGGQFIISSDNKKDSFLYDIRENTWLQEGEDNSAQLTVSTDEFVPDKDNDSKTIIAGENYSLCAVGGSVKDKGNNHLNEEQLLDFCLPKEEARLVSTNMLSVKNSSKGNIYIISAVVFLSLIMLAVIIIIKIKKFKGIDRNKKE